MGDGISKHVPVRSIWLLQLYASAVYQAGDISDSATDDVDVDLPVLVTSMLVETVEQRIQRELSVGFIQTSSRLHRVRGRIDVYETTRHRLHDKGQVACRFNELSVDTSVNRYLLQALRSAALMMRRLGQNELAQRCRRLASVFHQAGVSSSGMKDSVPQGRLSRADKKPIRLAQLLLDMKIPAPGNGRAGLRRTDYSETELRALFEKALLGLYSHHLKPEGFSVHGGKKLYWDTSGDAKLLPEMKTDITVVSPEGERFIIDAKFTDMVSPSPYSGADRLKSAHVYQLMAYLLSQDSQEDESSKPTVGAMVYATSHGSLHEEFIVNGHRVVFTAVDLAQPPGEIRRRALEYIL